MGVKKFNDFYDGEKIEVKDKDGKWRHATVRMYGKQKMFDITFKNPKNTKTVTCTANHRWVLKNGDVTENLSVGDALYLTKVDVDYTPKTTDEIKYFCFGMIIGDGSDRNNHEFFYGNRIRLCGDKIKYKKYFTESGYQESTLENGDVELYHKRGWSKQKFLNDCGWKYLNKEQKISLFNGLYAADGCKDGRLCIHTSDKRVSQLIQDVAEIAGYYHIGITEKVRDTNYKKNAVLI